MSRALRASAVPILLVALASCAPEDRLPEYVQHVDQVSIAVTSCTETRFEMEVDHWVALVERRARAYPFQWRMERTEDVDSFEIVPHATAERPWPFDRPTRPPNVPPHAPVNMTIPPADEIEPGSYQYRIVIRCGDRVYDIDPEIWVD